MTTYRTVPEIPPCDCDTCQRAQWARDEVENADIRAQWRRDVSFGVDPQEDRPKKTFAQFIDEEIARGAAPGIRTSAVIADLLEREDRIKKGLPL